MQHVCRWGVGGSSSSSFHFAEVRRARRFEMAPLACRLWEGGRFMKMHAWGNGRLSWRDFINLVKIGSASHKKTYFRIFLSFFCHLAPVHFTASER